MKTLVGGASPEGYAAVAAAMRRVLAQIPHALMCEIEARSYCPHSRLTKHCEGNDPSFSCWRAPYLDEICPTALGGCGQYVNHLHILVDDRWTDQEGWLYVDGHHWHAACHTRPTPLA